MSLWLPVPYGKPKLPYCQLLIHVSMIHAFCLRTSSERELIEPHESMRVPSLLRSLRISKWKNKNQRKKMIRLVLMWFCCDKIVGPLRRRTRPARPGRVFLVLTSKFFFFLREIACHFTAKKLNKLKPAPRSSQKAKQMDWADGKKGKKKKTRCSQRPPGLLSEAKKTGGQTT